MFNTSMMLAVGDTPNGQASDGGFEDDECEEGEGLGIAGLGDSPHTRKLQMNILRETCLREIVFTLVKVFKLTNRHAECVRLADLVADPRYEIFKASENVNLVLVCLVAITTLVTLICSCLI